MIRKKATLVDALAPDVSFVAGRGEMAALIRQKDWSETPLGPLENWPQSLRTTVSLCLASNFPINIVWGPEHTQIYNDGYRVVCGDAHPRALGENYSVTWASAWPAIGEPFAQALAGETSYLQNQRMFLTRNGYLEETFFTFSHSPIRDESGGIGGLFHPVTETTATMLAERRTRALRDLSASLGAASDEAELAARAIEVLAQFGFDLPFVLIYQLEPGASAYRLVANHAVPPAAAGAASSIAAQATSPWPFAEALENSKAIEVCDLQSQLQGWCSGPYAEPPNRGFVLPINVPGAQRIPAILVAGASPRLPMDEAYRSFYELLAVTISSALATVRARDDERHRAQALAEIDRAKTAFFSNVSHEFRTPLTLLLGPLQETLADTSLAPAARERLQLAHRNSLRLLKLVNSLLDFARIEAGRIQASYEPTDLAALTRDLASTFRSTIERAGLAFEVRCEELGEPVYVDREMWEKIVLNLLSNAFKFTLQGSIAVRLYRDRSEAVFEVADTGAGVPEAEMPRLFERFHRVEGTPGRTQEGSGIGLALVQELLKLHAGSITATSELGKGTTFIGRLHFGTEHLPTEQVKQSHTLAPTAIRSEAFVQEALRWIPEDGTEKSSRLPALVEVSPSVLDQRFAATFGARIVLADDNADMRSYVRGLLSPFYQVESVADGEEALLAAREQLPDLILSDVMMPRMDGFGLLKALRREIELQNVPVILLSARAGEEAQIEGLDAGADDYLVKPFSARELVARVGAMLERERLHREALERQKDLRDAALAAGARLDRRTAQFETLLNEAPIGVYLVDADFRLREANPTARRVFGDIPDLIGRNFDEVMHILWPKQDADEVVRVFRHTLDTGERYQTPEYIETRLDRAVTEYYEWQINRIPLPDGRYGVVCYFRDISAYVQVRADLQTADRQKDEFLAMLAHELRNPLAAIRNAAEMLSRTVPADARAQIGIGVVKRQGSQLTRLVDDLLDVSRISRGRIDLKCLPLELASVITQAVETVEPLLREKRHVISVTTTCGYQPLYVNGDFARLMQSVANILTNAVKYTDAGGEIRVQTRAEDARAVIEISDTGVGIPPELLPRVFDLFVQSDRTLDRAQGGLGIGLAVVKRLIEMHGGQVTARSRTEGPTRGSTFEIRLPLIERPTAPTSETAPVKVPPQRILIVDDNIDAATSLALLLQIDDHQAEAVYSGRDALERAQSFKPAIVLLDLGLPEMNGYEVARRLRALPGLNAVRLVALTGYGQAEDRQRTQAAGFDDHLVKPVELAAIERLLAQFAPRMG